MKKENIAGRKYNLLKVIEDTGDLYVLCQCECNTIKKVNRWHLIHGRIKSCGCLNKKMTEARREQMYEHGYISRLKRDQPNKNNHTGVRGVCFNTRKQKYMATIYRGKSIFLGYFNTLEEAVSARKKAEEKYFEPIIKKYKEQE